MQQEVPIRVSRGIAKFAQETRNIPTINKFFGVDLAHQLVRQGHLANVIHANNVLGHVSDLNGMMQGFKILLKPDVICIIEVPYVRELVQRTPTYCRWSGCELTRIALRWLCHRDVTRLSHEVQWSHQLSFDDWLVWTIRWWHKALRPKR